MGCVAIFLTIISMVIIKKSQHNPPVTERGTRSLNITVYYVKQLLGCGCSFVSFFTRKNNGRRIQKINAKLPEAWHTILRPCVAWEKN